MSLKIINLKRDVSKVLDTFISDVLIQTNENLYTTDAAFKAAGNDKMVNFGYIPDAGVKVNLAPIVRKLIDGSEYQRGFDFSFEIVSNQFYSMFQIEKFKNELCTINLYPIGIYIANVYVQVAVENNFDKDGNNKITISGKKFVKNIEDVYSPNPWGDAPPIWAAAASNSPTMPNSVHTSTPVGTYNLVSSRFESMRSNFTVSGQLLGLNYLL